MSFAAVSRSRGGKTEYPDVVIIETTNKCNAKCVFCPNNALSQNKRQMSDELFEKIIADCRQFPLEAIEPFMNGEPFVDTRIISRLEYIRRYLPRTKIRIFTNGHALTPKLIDQLVGIGIDKLVISLNTLDSVKHEESMGLKLERVLENISYLTHPVRKHKVARAIRFRMTRLPTTTLADQRRFSAFAKKYGVGCTIKAVFNYKGDIPTALPVPNYPCEHIGRLSILANGVVTLCCMDPDGEYVLGNVNESSVLDIFNGAAAQRYRAFHRTGRRKDIIPCNVCNLSTPTLSHVPLATAAKFAAQVAYYYMRHRPLGQMRPLGTEE